MDDTTMTTEQRQLLVEIEAVTRNIARASDRSRTSYEVEQGRKLIEKAISLKLPDDTYAELRSHIEKQDG